MPVTRKPPVRQRNRAALARGTVIPRNPATVTSAVSATKWRVTCSAPVVVTGVPRTFTVNNAVPTGIALVSPTVFDLTFAVAVAAGQTWRVGLNDPAVRTYAGGFVASATGTF